MVLKRQYDRVLWRLEGTLSYSFNHILKHTSNSESRKQNCLPVSAYKYCQLLLLPYPETQRKFILLANGTDSMVLLSLEVSTHTHTHTDTHTHTHDHQSEVSTHTHTHNTHTHNTHDHQSEVSTHTHHLPIGDHQWEVFTHTWSAHWWSLVWGIHTYIIYPLVFISVRYPHTHDLPTGDH